MQLTLIAGARPNFMKIAPLIEAIEKAEGEGKNIHYRLVHTGQHYDRNMSLAFFEQLGIPEPHINLGAGGGSQAEQTASIMLGFEQELRAHPADLVIVVGDVTSTLACSIVAKKMNTLVGHVEGGIRSGDRTMPEEINRIVTDSISDYFFTTSEVANANLISMGVSDKSIFFVGNTMIDTLFRHLPRIRKPGFWDDSGLTEGSYLVMTMHRPSNVDQPEQLEQILKAIADNSHGLPVIFPVHPRTAKTLEDINFEYQHLHLVAPMGYLEFIFLVKNAKAVITDSGGITEETTVLGIPCMTLRDSTERPETVTIGTNEILGTAPEAIKPAMDQLFAGKWKKGGIPPKWDGKAAERIVDALLALKN